MDGLVVGADELDLPEVEHPGALQLHRQVEGRLTAQRGQQRVRALDLDDARERGEVERLDVGPRREPRVGHDGGRVAVDQHHLVALVQQHLAGLRTGVVELAGLPDDDRSRADDEDLVQVVAAGHQADSPAKLRISFAEAIEQVERVVRPRRGLGVILHREGVQGRGRHALHRAVVEVHVGDLGAGDGAALPHGEAVVLRGDLDALRAQVLDRVVGAAVPELELEGTHAERLRQQLVPEADAEHRDLAEQALDRLDGVPHGGRVAGAVTQEHAVRAPLEHLAGARLGGHDGDAEAAPGEVGEHRALDAVVVSDDVQVRRRRPGGRRRFVGRLTGDDTRQVEAAHLRQPLGGLAQVARVAALRGDHGAQRALLADVAGEGARVHAAHGQHAVLGEPVQPRLPRGAVEAVVGELAGDDGPGVRLARLVAVRVGAVVAVHRERVGDELAAVRRVGGDLLVAGHARVEHQLATHRAGPGERLAGEGGAVLEDDDRRR